MQLFGGGRQLRGRALDVLQGVAQGLLHLPDRLLHLGDLVTPAALDGTTQVTCGDRGCRCFSASSGRLMLRSRTMAKIPPPISMTSSKPMFSAGALV